MSVIDCLRERGFIDAVTSEELRERALHPMKVYVGFDPTADSLHLGNLVGIIALAWFQKFGHTPVVVLGGATGRIGDPSGKSVERPLLSSETIRHNISHIRRHFETVLKASPKPLIVDNDAWLGSCSLIDFLRDTGKHFRLGPMLAKESVRARLASEEGISFTEFSYQILQAYDFYHLFEKEGVSLQMGGSDQWGNITAGVELIRKLTSKAAYGLTFPLITRSDGKKFGKTEEGAIWLSKEKCSPYQFYQYLVRIPDADVIFLMKMLTFMELEEIAEYAQRMQQPDYPPNEAQKRLAEEVTRLIHGEVGLQTALRVTEAASPGSDAALDPGTLDAIMRDMPHMHLNPDEVIGKKFTDLAVAVGLLSSKGEAARLIQNGGAYLNNQPVGDPSFRIAAEHVIGGKYLLLSSGKKKKMLIVLNPA